MTEAGATPGARGLLGVQFWLLPGDGRRAVPREAAGGGEGYLINQVSGDLKETLVTYLLQVLEKSILYGKVVNSSDFQPLSPLGTRELPKFWGTPKKINK